MLGHEKEMKEQCESIRKGMSEWYDEHDDLLDYFGDGEIYGEDKDGNLIVGFGVYGSANIVITDEFVEFGSVRSEKFSERLTRGVRELKHILNHC